MDGDRLRLPANRNCYRLSRVSWALVKLLVPYVTENVSARRWSSRDSRVSGASKSRPASRKLQRLISGDRDLESRLGLCLEGLVHIPVKCRQHVKSLKCCYVRTKTTAWQRQHNSLFYFMCMYIFIDLNIYLYVCLPICLSFHLYYRTWVVNKRRYNNGIWLNSICLQHCTTTHTIMKMYVRWFYKQIHQTRRVLESANLDQLQKWVKRPTVYMYISFYARKQLLLSVRLKPCPVTWMDPSKTVQARITKSSTSAAKKTLASGTVKLFHKFKRGHPNEGAKWEGGRKICDF